MSIPKFTLNIPNMLSLARVILVPLFIYFILLKTVEGWFFALIVFAIASFTDLIDGWSARKLKQESAFGEFLDPLADKFLVLSALGALILLDPYLEIFDFWMIIIIAGRDVLITVMRYLALKRGTILKTSRFGKVKTAFQMGSIVIILMIYIVRKKEIFITHESLPYWIMVSVTILTALSGLRYLFTNWQLFVPVKKNQDEE